MEAFMHIGQRMCARVVAVSAFSAIAVWAAPVRAELWPQRAVRVIAPFAAGSSADLAARVFSDELARLWHQPVAVENRPGADGLIGTVAFVGMHDDHVLMFSPSAPFSVFPVTHEWLPYEPTRDIVPISAATDSFSAVAVSASLKVGSLAELVTLARSRPGQLNYHAASGAFPILFAGFAKSADIDMAFVSYRESPRAVLDLAEGRIDAMLTVVTTLLPPAQAGKIRLLAVTNEKRAPIIPEVPTVIEAGHPSLAYEGLSGFFGLRDIPAERRDRIAADVRAVAADPIISDRLRAVGLTARGSSPAEFAIAIEAQRAKIAAIAKSVGIKPTQ
jgi:tripartite-type tricarboxylate transporter receptor subunit TctC